MGGGAERGESTNVICTWTNDKQISRERKGERSVGLQETILYTN